MPARWIADRFYPLADALAAIELDGLVRGARLVDDLLKSAQVRVVSSEVYSGPRQMVVLDGEVEALNRAFEVALAVGGERVIDAMLLAHAHPGLLAALGGQMMKSPGHDDAILMVETETLASTFRAVDASLKAVPVFLTSWRLGRGMAGRGVFALRGEHANLEAAEEVVVEAAGAGLRECQLIPRPDPLGFWSDPFGQGAS